MNGLGMLKEYCEANKVEWNYLVNCIMQSRMVKPIYETCTIIMSG